MELSAIRHRNSYCECYAVDQDSVILLLQTGKDADSAFVICEDPFINQLYGKPQWYGERVPMPERLELEHHYLWRVQLKPAYKRLQYYFEIVSDGQSYLLFEDRVCPIEDKDKRSLQYFKFPWINPADVIAPPKDIRNTVWYQIMPDRFCKAKGTNTDERFKEWEQPDEPYFHSNYGGNLRGVIERMNYLQELGIGGIYFTPVFRAGSYHKYNTFDYEIIDPDFGTNDDMKELVRQAHQRGIKVMLDGVFNHCGMEWFAWKDVCEKGRASRYFDWFFINTDDFNNGKPNTDDGRYYTFSFWARMPKLNTNNEEVIRYFTDLCVRWVREWDIDGIRFDVGDEISHHFMASLRRALKAVKPELFLLGEIWFDSIDWLHGSEYDSVMNYPLSNCLNDFFSHEEMTAQELMYSMNECLTMYPRQITEVLFNFLDTHDTERAFESCHGNKDILLQRLALLLTLPGTPCIYYGTELALKGLNKYDNRQCMPWERIDRGDYKEFFSEVQKLLLLRRQHSLCSAYSTEIHPDASQPRLLKVVKKDGSKQLEILLNAGNEPITPQLHGKVLYSNAFDGTTLLPNGTVICETT